MPRSADFETELRHGIGEALKEARERAGLSQAEVQARLAEALGVPSVAPTTMSVYERGKKAPSLGTLDALVTILGQGEGALLKHITRALAPKK